MLCFPMLISSITGANPLPPEHKNGVFMRYCPSELGCSNSTLSFYGSRSGCEAATLDADEGYLPL